MPSNPWTELVWEALTLLPSRLQDFQFEPVGTTWHAFVDGTCSNPTCPAESLAAWAVTIADEGVLASGPLPGIQQCILRAEMFAVLCALKWAGGKFGCLHIWSDSQIVVDHFRELLAGVAKASNFEHVDLWTEVESCLVGAVCDVVIHKVFSHDDPDASQSPLEDWIRFWNNSVDKQAELANSTRPRFLNGVWDRYVDFRALWKKRVRLHSNFVLAIAAADVQEQEFSSDDECTDCIIPVFDVHHNTVERADCIDLLLNRDPVYSPLHPTVFHQLAQWLSHIDARSATMRWVSIVEIYVGFRLSVPDRAPVIVGGGLKDRYTPVTFAADFAFFKKVFFEIIGAMTEMPLESSHICLPELQIFTPLVAYTWGWDSDIESQVFAALSSFVRRRPIVNAQGWSRPWQP